MQWITAQDAFLGGPQGATRIIEVGPDQTLLNMARKTLTTEFATEDTAYGRVRELLSLKKDANTIYYRTEAHVALPEPAPAEAPVEKTTAVFVQQVNGVANPTPKTAHALITDTPIPALSILILLIATSLKRHAISLPTDIPINTLCGGRSTIQNEIIGDLTKEFGALPDQPEAMNIAELAAQLPNGRLGPCSMALVNKMAGMKLCAGGSVASLRKAFEGKGFGPGMQDRALVKCVAMQPDVRLATQNDVDGFAAEVASAVLKDVGIDPASVATIDQDISSTETGQVVSSKALQDLRVEMQGTYKDVRQLLARHSGQNYETTAAELTTLRAAVGDLQQRLDAWTAELGDKFEVGIVPALVGCQQKVRVYESWWNWAVQDVLRLFHGLASGNVSLDWAQDMIEKVARRSSDRLVKVVEWYSRRVQTLPAGEQRENAQHFMTMLETRVKAAAGQEATVFCHTTLSTSSLLQYKTDRKSMAEETIRILPDSAPSSLFSSSPSTPSFPDVSAIRPFCTSGTPFIKTLDNRDGWIYNTVLSTAYTSWFEHSALSGISFTDRTVLITGAGRNSIGAEIVSLLLSAGAQIVVTTSSYSYETLAFYRSLYNTHGARGSKLVVLPFNACSALDVDALVAYIYKDLCWDLDHVIPFAAISETGRPIDRIDSTSDLAHRAMLTNIVRLLGAIKAAKETRDIWTHPTHVLLPLSPNHGSFGQDGLYAESKFGLEALLYKYFSENWTDFLSLCGAVIGWTKGTGLMADNDALAVGVEAELGVRTFSIHEMAWHLVGLLDSEQLRTACDSGPLMADISGGLTPWLKLQPALDRIRQRVKDQADVERALAFEEARNSQNKTKVKLTPLARLKVNAMELPVWKDVEPYTTALQGMVDLDQVVVVVGFGEVGSCGSSRTRWELEVNGTLSIEGCLELAWAMGLVTYHKGPLSLSRAGGSNNYYSGWLDAETKTPITDSEIKTRYEGHILANTGIRPRARRGHDLVGPDSEQELHEIILQQDLAPIAVSAETAAHLVRQHGSHASITQADGQVYVTIHSGATLLLLKSKPFDHTISAQMPTGWSAARYGIPEDIISQVDPVTLYSLVAASEAFLSAGIPDPFELYGDDIGSGPAEVGNCLGTSMGGVQATFDLFKGQFLGRESQNDALAESFANTPAAWLNMLLLGAAGPIRTPVGACATALESLDNAYDLLVRGRARFVLAGGADSLERDVAQGFARMGATVDGTAEASKGRTPMEASRPMASTRAGFVEGEGCGVQILTTARTAIDLGLPVYGVIALTHTAADGIGRSLPAPGKGVLTAAAECGNAPGDVLDIGYRKAQLDTELARIARDREAEFEFINSQQQIPAAEKSRKLAQVISRTEAAVRSARQYYCSRLCFDKTISPLRGALAVWGLTIDDVEVASMHGTSTSLGDINEAMVLQLQLAHLGRKPGNVMACVCQKSVVGHAKAAAGALAVNGALQILSSQGCVPGNRHLDDVEVKLREKDMLFFPGQTVDIGQGMVKAVTITSFGFGQKGAQVLAVNPALLFAALPGGEQEYEAYLHKSMERRAKANRAFQQVLYGGSGMVRVKKEGLVGKEEVGRVLLQRK